ncbi:MAG: 2-oxo acid dehydrogenase subunit E2 [Candidatus Lokiarchaeota archaeon]|nr:2-oxo acid dehydrogenase subunit E2 [Candidatus Lokiarchaeota archaeon]
MRKYNYKYEVRNITKTKQAEIDFISLGRNKNNISAIGVIDVTEVRNYFRSHLDEYGKPYSFTGYIAYLLGQAIKEHPHINAYMKGRKKIIIFEDVDIVAIVERQFEGYERPIPTAYTIRAAQKKHWKEIHKEIRNAQTRKAKGLQYDDKKKKQARRVKMFTKMPGWLRRILLKKAMRNPHQKKQFNGTIGLTSIGMFLQEGGNPIAVTPHVVSFQVGGTDWQPRFINGELKNREFLHACFSIDHNVIDGADAARFIATFRQMFTKGHGIDLSEPCDILPNEGYVEEL